MRRGLHQDLNFVLPDKDNYLGYPQYFNKLYVGDGLMDDSEQFNILAHHCRFSPPDVRALMPNDTVKVAIVRHPVPLFESLFNFYDLGKYWGRQKALTLTEFLSRTEEEIKHLISSVDRMGYRIGQNQLAFDFGFDPYFMNNQSVFEQFVHMLGEEFQLVMLTEYLEVSMVLLADLMCWPLEEVAFIPLNVRTDSRLPQLSALHKRKIEKINRQDVSIYDFFQ
ncbi:Hypothetical predicted protein [Cloeon dipterum]|uniref:Sulfotransferase domain-containing protein n=1 Tax=Cloeon dipterum TaxID=197152 RepID=A0A8S1DTA3_9INSE|nr:Hypothetical predicted protein [Cloeon dipterum]